MVNEEVYKWTVSPDSGYAVFVAESGTVKGSRIEVYVPSDCNDYWPNFPYVKELNMRVVTPGDAARFISQAIEQEWNSQKRGSPMVFDLVNGTIIRRR